MTIPSSSPSRIVRESFDIDWDHHNALGEAGVQRLMDETEQKALATSARIGVTRPVVRARQWTLLCLPGEYPMYLCGPEAPRITCAMDVFTHVWHLTNPWARYIVTVDDQDDLDRRDKEWMADLVAKARAEGVESLSPQWAPNVIEMVRREMG